MQWEIANQYRNGLGATWLPIFQHRVFDGLGTWAPQFAPLALAQSYSRAEVLPIFEEAK